MDQRALSAPPELRHGGTSVPPPASLDALLEQEVYAPLSPEARDLLLAVHPLERFTARQAAFLGGGRDADRLLSALGERNSFLFRNERDHSYTLHSVVRRHVGKRFDALSEARRRSIFSKLADWFVQEGETVEAVDACRRAGQIDRALTVLESDMSRHLVTENARFFLEFFNACPKETLKKHLPAAFKFALAALSAGDFPAFGAQLAWLAEVAAALPENSPESDAVRGELELLRSLAAYNDIAAMSAHHRRANELLQRPTRLFGPDSPWTLGSPSVLFMFHRDSGKLAHEIELMRECLPHYYRLAAGHGSGGELLMEAEALYHAGNFGQAAIVCHKARAAARDKNQLGNVLVAMFLRIRLALAAGKYDEAAVTVREMRTMIREKRDYFFLHTVDLCEGHLQAALGRSGDVPSWLGAQADGEKRLYSFAGGYYYLVHGRFLLLENRAAELLGLFSWIAESGVFARHLLFAIYATIFTAAAHNALGDAGKAKKALADALALALPDGILMPFVENWDFVGEIADGISGETEELSRLRTLASDWEKKRRGMTARHFPHFRPPLTEREMEMARLAASGMKYREIASELYLAPTTVKKAFVHIYRKLGISSRDELCEYMRNR